MVMPSCSQGALVPLNLLKNVSSNSSILCDYVSFGVMHFNMAFIFKAIIHFQKQSLQGQIPWYKMIVIYYFLMRHHVTHTILQQAVPINGDNIPPLITTHLIQKCPHPNIPLSVNARYVMNETNSYFFQFPETPFSAKYLATRWLNIRLGTWKCKGVKRLTP